MKKRTDIYFDKQGRIIVFKEAEDTKYITLTGGGAKGAFYPGVIEALEEKEMLEKIEGISGSSAGAMTATLVALGKKSKEIKKIVNKTDFNKFKDYSLGDNINKMGLCDGNAMLENTKEIIKNQKKKILTDITQLLEKKLTNEDKETLQEIKKRPGLKFKDLTFFRKLYEEHGGKTQKNKIKELVITGTEISSDSPKLEIFSSKTTPEMDIALANRISASLPILFKTVDHEGKTYIDGGVLNNTPIEPLRVLLDKKNPAYRNENLFNQQVLAFTFSSEEKSETKTRKWDRLLHNIGPAVEKTLKNTLTHWVLKAYRVDYYKYTQKTLQSIRDKFSMRTLPLWTRGIGTTDFDISETDKENAQQEAKKETKEYTEEQIEGSATYKTYDDKIEFLLQEDLDVLKSLKNLNENENVTLRHANPNKKTKIKINTDLIDRALKTRGNLEKKYEKFGELIKKLNVLMTKKTKNKYGEIKSTLKEINKLLEQKQKINIKHRKIMYKKITGKHQKKYKKILRTLRNETKSYLTNKEPISKSTKNILETDHEHPENHNAILNNDAFNKLLSKKNEIGKNGRKWKLEGKEKDKYEAIKKIEDAIRNKETPTEILGTIKNNKEKISKNTGTGLYGFFNNGAQSQSEKLLKKFEEYIKTLGPSQ